MRRLAASLAWVAAASPLHAEVPQWRPLDPQNTLVVETTAGRIVIAMDPELAPLAVERIKLLSREGVYDGLLFHRVIDHFVDQTGNPNNKDGGVSSHPDLPPEFDAMIPPDRLAPVSMPTGAVLGFLGAIPVQATRRSGAKGPARTWGLYCSGVAGMGRQASWGSANSEIFFMRGPARRLDHEYTVWGRVVAGLDVVRKIKLGEPPKDPDRMLSVRVAADLPQAARPRIEVMNVQSAGFAELVARARSARGPAFSPCDIDVPVRGG